jgi:multiple sugar transport system substrate-binding protein
MWTRTIAARALFALALGAGAGGARAADRTTITFARFFGACEADYGKTTDPSKAEGECGIITALINQFNATNKEGITVEPQIIEWGPYYDQISARMVSGDVPDVAVMHESVLGDFVARNLVQPLDADLKTAGIDPGQFTEQAKRGVTVNGKVYALPFDTHAWLWHVNGNLFKKAGLAAADGKVQLPKSADELLAQARKFKQATGKAYFAWPTVNETASPLRTLITFVAQQNGALFPGGQLDLHSKEAMAALQLMDTLYKEGHIKHDLDYGAANQAFLNGDVGVVVVGTWTIGDFVKASEKADSPLHGGYQVYPFAQLYASKAAWADGHSWVLLRGAAKDPAKRKAAQSLLKFLFDNDYQWARTGHLPANQKVLASAEFQKLPFRKNILEITKTGAAIPLSVPRQRALQDIVGEEIENMWLTGKPLAAAAKDAEARTNELLASARSEAKEGTGAGK